MQLRHDIEDAIIRRMVEMDLPEGTIAAHFQCSVRCIQYRKKKAGIRSKRTGPKNGDRHPNWKGGRKLVGEYVYIYAPEHPDRTKCGYVCEHRLVMERTLGRRLCHKEVVHHRDGNRANNTPGNLKIFSTNALHLRHELKGRIPKWSSEGKKRIREGGKESRQRRRTQKESEYDGPLELRPIPPRQA